jgi:phosphohistidine swiveling domain-containing protein
VKYIFKSGSIEDLGGKGYGLAQLQQEGLSVPEWFAVSPLGFEDSLTELQKSAFKSGNVQDIRSAVESVLIDPSVRHEIELALGELSHNGESFAVRSSALDEDAGDCSFAGQLESYLSVSASAVPEKIATVWRSGFSERVLAYRSEHGRPPLPQKAPAVVIQRMIRPEAAGVAFSADPVTGRTGTVVISAVLGLASGLVSGETDSDDYQLDRSGKVLRRQRPDSVAPEHARTLTDQQVTRIGKAARQIARRLGRPQDIEWAIEGDDLYVLQTRPITTLSNLPDPDAVRNIWDNSNITESYSGVTTPLTFSFARSAYEGVYREFCRILKVPESKLAANDQVFGHMLGLIRGRVYYNLLNWYRVLALLPGFTVNRRFMEQMMGVKEPLPADVADTFARATLGERVRDAWNLGRMLAALVWNYFTLDRKIHRFYARLENALADSPASFAEMRMDELAACYDKLLCQLLRRWDAPLLNDFFTMIFHGLLRQLCQHWLKGGDRLANELVRVQGGMISVEPAVRLREMAAVVAGNPELAEMLRSGDRAGCERVIQENPDLSARYDEYLQQFGERCLEELKLESETLHDDPSLLFRSIGELARDPRPTPAANVEEPNATSTEQRARKTLSRSPLRRLLFTWILRNAREHVRARENLRFERTHVFGRVRSIFVEIGLRLYALDRLDHPRDIFYLHIEEVLGFNDGTTVTTGLKQLVALRKREFQEFRTTVAPPDRFETQGPVHHITQFQPSRTSQASEISGEERQGLGCCAGTVRGRVCLVTDPHSASLPAGSILVAERTDPGWVLLFPAAAGLIVERGSLLSHSAIVSRELGIPSVVSIPGVTKWLRDGDLVEIDGGKGTVRRLLGTEAHVA